TFCVHFVNVVSLVVGRCVDACYLLLDLILRTSGWLLHFLSGVGFYFHNTLVILSSSTLVEYWNFAVFSFLTITEAISGATHATLHAVESWLQMLGGVFESFKMVGHLLCHVAWRTKDVLHRGFILGSCVLRQTCEGILIVLSLILYFVNTVVNIVLIGTQNCLSLLAGVWDTVADPIYKVAELALNLLTFLYSCLVGASVLLLMPCQLLLDFLGALGRVFITVFMVDSHSLLATAVAISLALVVLNPRLPALAGRLSLRWASALPGARGVWTTFVRLYTVMLESALAFQVVHTETTHGMSRTRLPLTEAELLPESSLSLDDSARPQGLQHTGPGSGDAGMNTSHLSSAIEDGELLRLLKEQEERKKCVICQDMSKTVLLLPCCHLCLCRHCADILTQCRPAQQRCCPLCRQPITETLDVFL
uniref:E3 ubiquitin-protein ligase RNF26 n=1 Tax=Echeneis naucrates TaxID=173247 RepID=A0A665V0I1_ECHNA